MISTTATVFLQGASEYLGPAIQRGAYWFEGQLRGMDLERALLWGAGLFLLLFVWNKVVR